PEHRRRHAPPPAEQQNRDRTERGEGVAGAGQKEADHGVQADADRRSRDAHEIVERPHEPLRPDRHLLRRALATTPARGYSISVELDARSLLLVACHREYSNLIAATECARSRPSFHSRRRP